jgi:hypothetical protein
MRDSFQEETSIPATSEIFRPVTCADMSESTFSQALAAGHTHCGWLGGRTASLFGREVALVSHSASREKALGLKMSATFGPLFGGLSPNAGRRLSLASRLRASTGLTGSPEFTTTWKRSVTQCLRMGTASMSCTIFRLRASGRRISGNGCSGWVSPKASDCKSPGKSMDVHLNHQAALSGWPTCSTRDSKGGYEGGRIRNGKISTDTLDVVAQLAGWPTPRTITGGPESAERKQELGRTASGGGDLQAVVQMANMGATVQLAAEGSTPGLRSLHAGSTPAAPYHRQKDSGLTPPSSPAPTGNGGGLALNPKFSLWLQGYPIEWAYCGERVTQSSRK